MPAGIDTVKIVVLDGRTLAPDRSAWAGLDRLGELVLHDFSTAEEIPVRAADAAILMTCSSSTPTSRDISITSQSCCPWFAPAA